MKRFSPLLVLVPVLLSCGGNSNTPSSSKESSQEPSSQSVVPETYTEKEINVRYVDPSMDQKTKLRFYEGSPDIPYMPIDEYYALLLNGRSQEPERYKLSVLHDNNLYVVTSPNGQADFDVVADTMETDNLSFFISTKTYEDGYNALMGTDGCPWIQIEDVIPESDPVKVTVDFGKYHIDLRGDGDKLYLPLPTLQDLFSDSDLLTSLYNRQDLFVYSGADGEDTKSFGLDTYEPCLKTDLGKEYAEFLYNELCFDYDVILGRPTRSSLERYYDLSKGLDAALESRPLGKLIKQYFTDGTAVGYATGLSLFGRLTADGGHTTVGPFNSVNYDLEKGTPVMPSWYNRVYMQVENALHKVERENYEEYVNACLGYRHHSEIRMDRKDGLGLNATSTANLRGEQTYKKINSTAFILIDDYMGDCTNLEAWNNYYAGTGALPFGPSTGGAVACIYKGLLKAQADSSVKNVVVDLSSNTGGSVDEMMYLISLLTENKVGETTMSIANRATGQLLTGKFKVDRNLDRVFDEKDAAFNPVAGKNIAVLMSQNGFSCGGISPIYLHDRGIFTMGDDSGGGCCSILYQHSGMGLFTVRSSSDAVVDKNGKKIDEVREGSCDHKFEIKEKTGSYGTKTLDFSSFFKIEEIERVLKDHFVD